MLNIFYGREDIDKSKFIYEHTEGKTILIVPDQFTLQAEKDAFFYLHKDAFIDLDVMSFSRLGNRVLDKAGIRKNFIGLEGRQMLLTGIIAKRREQLEVFGGSALKQDFVSLVNNLISEFKQHEVSPANLNEAKSHIEEGSLLHRKLSEMQLIFEDYEAAIKDKYTDSEDKISLFAENMDKADFVKESSIWIYAFDSFTEKNLTVIKSLEKWAKAVNIVLTYSDEDKSSELFALTGRLINRFKRDYSDVQISKIDDAYKRKMSPDIAHIEKELFTAVPEITESVGDIKVVRAANIYNQAATAAAHVKSLVRDRGYKYGDIAVISNDLENKGYLYKRVFEEYGMKLFIDNKRDITGHPVVMATVALLDVAERFYRREDVMKYIKSGLVLDAEEVSKLEIYAERYGITRGRWIKPFTLGAGVYGDEGLKEIENIRKKVIEPIEAFCQEFKETENLSERVDAIIRHMEGRCAVVDKLNAMAESQDKAGMLEQSAQTVQIWDKMTDIFNQMKEIIGDEKISAREFSKLLNTGLSAVKLGLIPPGADSLIMGNMQRTRRNRVKAVVVLDASEDMLPMDRDEAGILSEEEKKILAENDIDICNMGSLMSMEESMAIYRNLSMAEEHLYMSYAASDNEGKGVEASQVFSEVCEMLKIKPEKDIFAEGNPEDFIGGRDAAVNNLIGAMREIAEGKEEEDEGIKFDQRVWAEVFSWFSQREDVQKIADAITERFGVGSSEGARAAELYRKTEEGILKVSPSRMEKFGKCPFAHFISYGLRPEEIKEYKVEAPEAGSIYHSCIMGVSQKLSEGLKEKGMNITDSNSPWMTVTRQDVEEMTEKMLSQIASEYNEGLLKRGNVEKYRYERIKEVCNDSIWMIIKQVRKGSIKDMMFEAGFGENKQLPALAATDKVLIEGQIDRFDILKDDYSKVIDYKSGQDRYNEAEAKAGVKLQLFIYLMASSGIDLKPGGAFYFHVKDAMVKNPKKTGRIDREANLDSEYKLDGFLLGDSGVTDAIDPDGKIFKGKNRIMSKTDFDALTGEVMSKVKEMAEELSQGEIGIKPKKVGNVEACQYCTYKGICKFDLSVEGCSYNMI